ncbi:MAG TPA: DNA-primase RepB domain-containing protein [Terriglobales bacterium]|nr:DNA-primase RepB domain-containing protein [Terriglobales bacterium]
MPNELYLIRLIHHETRRPFPGERLWTADQLSNACTVRFLRARNCEGCDVYLQPYAGSQNAGYILVDLDGADPMVVDLMRVNGHHPCVVLETSPGHRQAWIRLSTSPLEAALATAAGKHLARLYGGDPASTDWRHLGRLAGFTNPKPTRRTWDGYALWVKVLYARAVLAPGADTLLQSLRPLAQPALDLPFRSTAITTASEISATEAIAIYQVCMQRWRIVERFPRPDWSIVDLWVARHLLARGTSATQVQTVLRLASPAFPRRHGNPEDYLRRTLARAAFPSPRCPVCHAAAPAAAPLTSACSNSTGGR